MTAETVSVNRDELTALLKAVTKLSLTAATSAMAPGSVSAKEVGKVIEEVGLAMLPVEKAAHRDD